MPDRPGRPSAPPAPPDRTGRAHRPNRCAVCPDRLCWAARTGRGSRPAGPPPAAASPVPAGTGNLGSDPAASAAAVALPVAGQVGPAGEESLVRPELAPGLPSLQGTQNQGSRMPPLSLGYSCCCHSGCTLEFRGGESSLLEGQYHAVAMGERTT